MINRRRFLQSVALAPALDATFRTEMVPRDDNPRDPCEDSWLVFEAAALRCELRQLIVSNYADQWVDHQTALQQLDAVGKKDLVLGLIECLEDSDAEVRSEAIRLLDAVGSPSEPAIPALVRKLVDPDKLVRIAAASSLGKFGTKASIASMQLERWLTDDNEYVRILAATTVLRVDPTRGPALGPAVLAATKSENIVVRHHAEEYLAEAAIPALLPTG